MAVTKAMTMAGGKVIGNLSKQAIRRRLEGVGLSYCEQGRRTQKVICELCGTQVNQQSLKVHQTRRVCKSGRATYQTTTTNNVVNMPTKEFLDWEEEDFPSKYVISVNGETGTQCPVPNCPVKPVTRRTMRVHFRNVHNERIH
jgi:hypothetical protein